ncbi:MAG TPA: CPBP family intramembrane metalloprotease [Saprospiraceae bacterium]|nr:CPBP family intramembrane metalloprotease [Saprospiraceae bacterium]
MLSSSKKALLQVFGGFTLIFITIDRVAAYFGPDDLTTGFWAAAIIAVVIAIVLEILVFKHKLPAAIRFLGFGRPHKRTLIVTAVVCGLTLLYFPIFSSLTGASVSIPDNWLWKLSGIVAIHGIAEEVLFRGFVFHHLRAGRTFHQAAFLSMLVFAIAHVYLFTYMPAPLALFATFLALASTYPFAYLFEQGNNTIWAPALFHTGVHAVSFFVISESHAMIAGMVWMSIWIISALLIYILRGRLFERSTSA